MALLNYLYLYRNKITNEVYVATKDHNHELPKDYFGRMPILWKVEGFDSILFKLELTTDEINNLHEYCKSYKEVPLESKIQKEYVNTYKDIRNRLSKVFYPEKYVKPRKPRKKKGETEQCISQE